MRFITLIIVGVIAMTPDKAQTQSCNTASDCPTNLYDCVKGTCVCTCPASAPLCEPDGSCGY